MFYNPYFASLSITGYVLPLFTGEIMKQNVLIKGISDCQFIAWILTDRMEITIVSTNRIGIAIVTNGYLRIRTRNILR
jgi:hypothetical protein